ncbi:MAG: serine/threonine protein kinase [Myxococcales bacterium]|nr:serine/threonine protein kinase [Myxococcales bacterium]
MNASGDHTASFPKTVGRYEILLPIASGGMATVYLARARGDQGFTRDVALKLVHEHLRREPAFLRDVIEEAKIAAKIRHPHVVPVLDVGEDRSGAYLVMEYIEGASLSGLYRAAASAGTRLSPGVTLRILLDALSGLHAAHELGDGRGGSLGVVHRDFSPQNILIGSDGIARLTDFGIAKARSRISHTKTGVTKGKLAYMSPEQARGKPLDRRTDVWAAGVIAWEAIARRRLFKGNEADIVLDVGHKPIPDLGQIDPEVPPELAQAVAGALSRDLKQRTPTAQALRDALASGARGEWRAADTEEVASTVERLLGAELAERRSRSARELTRELTTIQPQEPTLPDAVPAASQLESATLRTAQATEPNVPSGDRAAASQPRPRNWGIALALLGTLLVGIGTGIAFQKQSGAERQERAEPRPRYSATPASAAAAPAAEPSTSLAASNGPTPPEASAAEDAAASSLALTALIIESNLPLATLQIDGAAMPLERGTKRVELAVSTGPHDVEASTTSGRRLRMKSTSGRLMLQFPPLPTSRPLVENPY